MLTVIGSENCDSMFAIAALIVASMAAALGSLVIDTSNVGLMCRPADTARGAPDAGAALSTLGRKSEGTSPGSTTCFIGTGERVMVLLPAPCAAAIRTGSSATAIRHTRIVVVRAIFGQLITVRCYLNDVTAIIRKA